MFTDYPTVMYMRLHQDAPTPRYAKDGDAGFDLSTMETVDVGPHETVEVGCGLAFAIPENFEGEVRPRSGMARDYGITIANTPGTIDSGYRGEVKLPLHNMTDKPVHIEKGTRVCQMVIHRLPVVTFEEVDELDETERGDTGFGSSGYGSITGGPRL